MLSETIQGVLLLEKQNKTDLALLVLTVNKNQKEEQLEEFPIHSIFPHWSLTGTWETKVSSDYWRNVVFGWRVCVETH